MTGLNKMLKEFLLCSGMMAGLILLNACNNGNSSSKKNKPAETHQAQIQNEGTGMIYVDEIPSNAVVQSTDSAGSNTVFHCYLVGFIDSLSVAKAVDKKDIETGKYYQYDMQNDWVALINGDSLKPAFFQPKQRLEKHRYEGIIVFETSKNKAPDTLVYRDSYGSWGTQQIIIK